MAPNIPGKVEALFPAPGDPGTASNALLAVHLARAGLPVFPCQPHSKAPYYAGGFHSATTDEAEVARLWQAHPQAMIGLPTGPASGLFVVDLDIDKETGEAVGEATLAALGLSDLILSTPGALTPSGGRHLYFADPGEGFGNTTGRIGPKVDTRGAGGYVIAPGSVAPGGRYEPVGRLLRGAPPPLPPELRTALQRPAHAPQRGLSQHGLSIDLGHHDRADLAEVQEILSFIPPGCGYDDWFRVLMGLHDHFGGSAEGLALADRWSAGSDKYRPGEVAAKWQGFRPGGGAGWGTVCALARQNGANLSEIAKRHRGADARPFAVAGDFMRHDMRQEEPDDAGEYVSAASLAGLPVPAREWSVPGIVPFGTVTKLDGDGGTGKSLLALQLAVATASGGRWIGQDVRQGRALYIGAEDDRDEMHRRLVDVTQAQGLDLSDLGALTFRSLAGKDALLAVQEGGGKNTLKATPLYQAVARWIAEHRPVLVVLDTLSDLFGGNEIDRTQARQFIGLLRALCIEHRTTIVLLAHPSLTGMSSGTGSSGSTAWSNSVRSRLYFRRIKFAEGDEPDPDARELEVMKANYGRIGTVYPLRWRAGAFVLETPPDGLDRMAASAKAERVFLRLLRRFTDEGRHVSANPGPTYAPTVFAGSPDAEGCTKKALRAAMEALFAKGRLRVEQHGRGAKARSHLAEVQRDGD